MANSAFDPSCDVKPYAFPRVMAMIGDGKTDYNGARDGGGQELGACSVSPMLKQSQRCWRENNLKEFCSPSITD